MSAVLVLALALIASVESREGDDYVDSARNATALRHDELEDYDQYEIDEYEDEAQKIYHCSSRTGAARPDQRVIRMLDDAGVGSVRRRKQQYQVRSVRQRMCQSGFDPFHLDTGAGSIHRRFRSTLRLMIYNTPGMFPGLKVVRSDLDRRRKREPQIWFRFEANANPLSAEFDYDNYFVTVYGDFSRVQAFSKLLVALKMHKRVNNFNNSVSDKINLDLGIIEIILSNFGVPLLKDKTTVNLLVKALNGIRTELKPGGDVIVEFEESMKEAVDQIDPLLYSSVWLQSTAENFEVLRLNQRAKSTDKRKKSSGR